MEEKEGVAGLGDGGATGGASTGALALALRDPRKVIDGSAGMRDSKVRESEMTPRASFRAVIRAEKPNLDSWIGLSKKFDKISWLQHLCSSSS